MLIQRWLIYIFKIRGVPKCIKVDNGRPFGDPKLTSISPLALWLIGMGIKVVWNRPATPQDNAKVERAQGVMGKWTDFQNCKDTFDLQVKLWKEADFYNYHFPIKRHRNKKRIEIFPQLEHTGKNWNPNDFKLNRVLLFIAKGQWERKVSKNGQVSIFGKRFSIGSSYKHQIVSFKLKPNKNVWCVFDAKGQIIQEKPSSFTVKKIWNLDLS